LSIILISRFHYNTDNYPFSAGQRMAINTNLHPVTVDDIPIGGKILATGVSHDDFMAGYTGMRVEWVNGTVIEMPGIEEVHDRLVYFLRTLLTVLLEITGGGRVMGDPMLMKIPDVSSRAPDLQMLLPESLEKLHHNVVMGAADLVIEVVSPGTGRIDQVEKFREYEEGGVPEYWTLDPQDKEAQFWQLDADTKKYEKFYPDEHGIYQSKVLPKLRLNVAWLWRDPLRGVRETVQLVEAMLAESKAQE
jgi:Uma2 family endonuclease